MPIPQMPSPPRSAALRPAATGKLAVLFGCGGDRDKGKRAKMGQIASTGADQIFVTDDNPRTEDAASIRAVNYLRLSKRH